MEQAPIRIFLLFDCVSEAFSRTARCVLEVGDDARLKIARSSSSTLPLCQGS